MRENENGILFEKKTKDKPPIYKQNDHDDDNMRTYGCNIFVCLFVCLFVDGDRCILFIFYFVHVWSS